MSHGTIRSNNDQRKGHLEDEEVNTDPRGDKGTEEAGVPHSR